MASVTEETAFFHRSTRCPFLALCFYIMAFFSVEAFYSSFSAPTLLISPSSGYHISNRISGKGHHRHVKGTKQCNRPIQATTIPSTSVSLQENLPLSLWETSIVDSSPLPFTPLMTHHLEVLFSRLNDLKAYPMPSHLEFRESQNKPGRMATYCFQSKEFKKIRMSFADCGPALHVFNVLMEPNPQLDIPMFGAEFLSIGQRHLVVVDFLPMFEDATYIEKYIDPLNEIKQRNPHLIGDLSGKHYEDARFFSHNMLFARKLGGEKIEVDSVMPAFQEYLEAYINLAQTTTPNPDPAFMKRVEARHLEFGEYSGARDPARAIFEGWFGKEWAQDFANFIH